MTPDELFMARQKAQELAISRGTVAGSRAGIMFDVDGELALRYFGIDSFLLTRVPRHG